MQRLVEVVGGGQRVLVRPQDVHQLLAMEAMAGRQGQQLDDMGRLGEAP